MLRRPSFKRWNPLLGEWIIFAPTTAVRPWSGTTVTKEKNILPEYDPVCYLCPGVTRAEGDVNPDYTDVFVFDNDFPSLSMNIRRDQNDKTQAMDVPVSGICRVICFSPKHNITLAEMNPDSFVTVIHTFRDQYRELSSIPEIRNVMIFENKGTIIGVSNPHPHGQIYATDFIPRNMLAQYSNARNFMDNNNICLFCHVMDEEIADGRRIVTQNSDFIAYVPYFARHTFEIHIMPRRHVPSITFLTEDELLSLAEVYREILIRFDNLFEMSFPNITIFHNAPCSDELDPAPYHFHIEFCPPLRSRNKLKYMAGFETGGGNIINPSLPCESAEMLRDMSTMHYTMSS